MREAALSLLYRKRLVWLVLLVFGNLFSGAGIAYFETPLGWCSSCRFWWAARLRTQDAGGTVAYKMFPVHARGLRPLPGLGYASLRDRRKPCCLSAR